MDSVALLASAFMGLAAAFIGSAVWATRRRPLATGGRVRRLDGRRG